MMQTKTVYAVEIIARRNDAETLADHIAKLTGEEFVGFVQGLPDEAYEDEEDDENPARDFVVDSENPKLAAIIADVDGIEVAHVRDAKHLAFDEVDRRWLEVDDLPLVVLDGAHRRLGGIR